MRIPEIRDEMQAAANETTDPVFRAKLLRWVGELRRRKPVRKAPPQCRTMSVALAAAIRRYAADHPGEGYQAMSTRFSVSVGRISEVLAGRRA